jgi:hypothetical protein
MEGSHTGFEVFIVVTMKNAIFLDVVPCGFIINRRFASIFRIEEIMCARKSVRW